MSTFNGFLDEFPLIRIDHFRTNPDKPPPQACFLSHVHSDHLQGLESLRSPFIYCSAATREILLRIEKYPHRMNFAKGILESRKQEYKHLSKLLRPLPLHVPTEIELRPGDSIRVTLFDANHCPGAVMFLIEGNGRAILYTGDVRAEPWWVESITRNPVLIPYTLGDRRLDRIYLDTTFAIKTDIYASFPSKAEGIRELLQKIKAYPPDTIFYLRNWTFGYEDVWVALSAALNTKIHVDKYQLRLYGSLSSNANRGFGINEAPHLCGFTLGNSQVTGCLTDQINTDSVRVHSCEPGVVCSTISSGHSVYITPIVSRTMDGEDVLELGAGGGMGDLTQTHDLQLPDESAVERFVTLCSEHIEDPPKRKSIIDAVSKAYQSKSKSLSLDSYGFQEEEEVTLRNLISMLSERTETERITAGGQNKYNKNLPNAIRFPYSRHSSYDELCALVGAFRPKDVFPCTVDLDRWTDAVSMETLFSHVCSGTVFAHDHEMRVNIDQDSQRPNKRARRGSISSSTVDSTQASHTEPKGPSDNTVPYTNPQEKVQYPIINLVSSSETRSQDTVRAENLGLTVTEPNLSPSFTTHVTNTAPQSQADQSSIQSDIDIRAIRQALRDKSRNNELEFHCDGSSCVISPQRVERRSLSQVVPSSPLYFSSLDDQQASNHISKDDEVDKSVDQQLDIVEETITLPSSPLSISSSAFGPQETISALEDDQDQRAFQMECGISPDLESKSGIPLHRTHSRMSAYRAVRDGTWSRLYSLVSAGNNHSHGEQEL